MRVFVRRLIGYRLFVENDYVCRKTFADLAAVAEVEGLSREGSHLSYRVLQGNDLQLADVLAEDAGVIAVAPRMRHARSEVSHPAI